MWVIVRFKKRRFYSSFTLKQTGWKLLGDHRIRIHGRVFKFVLTRPIEGLVKTVTIKRDRVGDLWLCFSVITDEEPPRHEEVTHPVGVDFGLKQFLTLSTGQVIDSPQFFKQGQKEIVRLNRQLSRKPRGSKNRRKARIRLAKAHRSIANERRD